MVNPGWLVAPPGNCDSHSYPAAVRIGGLFSLVNENMTDSPRYRCDSSGEITGRTTFALKLLDRPLISSLTFTLVTPVIGPAVILPPASMLTMPGVAGV